MDWSLCMGIFSIISNLSFKGIKSFPQTPIFSNLNIFEPQCCRLYTFQTMNYDKSFNLSLKYQKLTPYHYSYTDIGISKFEFGPKTQFLCPKERKKDLYT